MSANRRPFHSDWLWLLVPTTSSGNKKKGAKSGKSTVKRGHFNMMPSCLVTSRFYTNHKSNSVKLLTLCKAHVVPQLITQPYGRMVQCTSCTHAPWIRSRFTCPTIEPVQ